MKKANKFAASLMPTAPKTRVGVIQEAEPVATSSDEEVVQESAAAPAPAPVEASVVPAVQKVERTRKSAGFSVEEVVNAPTRNGEAFIKMVRVTDDHHELLRQLAFKYRKNMNVIVHNLIALLDQAYQKEQKGDQSNV